MAQQAPNYAAYASPAVQGYNAYSSFSSPPPGSFNYGGAAGDALGIYSGLERGGFAGYGGAALSAAKLANVGGANIPYLGPAGNVLAIYNGVKQGGVMGDTTAAVNAAQLYSAASAADVAAGGAGFAGAGAASSIGAYAAPIAAMYALYGIDQKQGMESPETVATGDYNSAANFQNAAKTVASGSTGPNGVYAGIGGTTSGQIEQGQEEEADLMKYLGNSALEMGEGQMNSGQYIMGKANPVTDMAQARAQIHTN